MKFSILVPVYNVEKYLEQCVESLLSQTFEGDYEIILVDDGSTDSSAKICDGYKEKYPHKIRVVHKENQGLISSRDVGIVQAQGEYCIFVDADDFIENNSLQLLSEEIEKNNSPDVVIYSFQYYDDGEIIQRQADFLNKRYTGNEIKYFYETLMYSPVFKSLCTKAVKTDILKNDPNDYTKYYGKNMGEDWLRSIHIFTEANTVVCRNVPLYNYRTNHSSISRDFSVGKIDSQKTLHVYEQLLKYLPKWEMEDAEHIGILKQYWLNETVYIFSKFYENAKNNNQRKMIVDYDWSSFLPSDFLIDELNNSDTVQCKLYYMIIRKQYSAIRLHFLKKSVYKKYKEIKNKVTK